jgi:leader peptidase (prepilin peptidase) / N-methyltransferase
VFLSWPILAALGFGIFLIGTVVGSFLNVCIYRIPWQKSVIWPGSRCPNCYTAICPRDNVPILSWLLLRGRCRHCGVPISMRYLLVEALVGFLFLGAYLVDVIAGPRAVWGQIPPFQLLAAAYHAVFLALLVAATFIDYDFMEIPDAITVTGWLLGIGMGTLWPRVRPLPVSGGTHLAGFGVGVVGFLAGALLTQAVRKGFGFLLRREAMGFGDVTLMGMIGGFLGWQAAVLTFFIAPFFGLAHVGWKLLKLFKKWFTGVQLSTGDRELPFGPYLSMAAACLYFFWNWSWPVFARTLFNPLFVIFWWMCGVNVDFPR